MTIWRVGMKAECIDQSLFHTAAFPLKGSIHIVDSIDVHPFSRRVGLNFAEFPDWTFCADHFRPVVDRPTSIAVFTEILDRVNRQAPVIPELEVLGAHFSASEAS